MLVFPQLLTGASAHTNADSVVFSKLPSSEAAAGLSDVRSIELTVRGAYATFEAWWEPYTLGVGPAGAYVASLSPEHLAALRDQCRRLLPAAPGEIAATAWAVTAHP